MTKKFRPLVQVVIAIHRYERPIERAVARTIWLPCTDPDLHRWYSFAGWPTKYRPGGRHRPLRNRHGLRRLLPKRGR